MYLNKTTLFRPFPHYVFMGKYLNMNSVIFLCLFFFYVKMFYIKKKKRNNENLLNGRQYFVIQDRDTYSNCGLHKSNIRIKPIESTVILTYIILTGTSVPLAPGSRCDPG